jgi:general secretion pathway protein C
LKLSIIIRDMAAHFSGHLAARWTAWLVWAALAGSLVFWGLRLFTRPPAVPAQVQTVAIDQAVQGDALRLLGAVAPAGEVAPPPPPAVARFKLVGAVASTGAGSSWAVLSVDDKPARVVKLGGAVDGQWVLQEVTARGVSLGPAGAPAQVTLELPRLPPPATGTLPSAVVPMPGAIQPLPGPGTGVGVGLPQQGILSPAMQPQMQPPPPAQQSEPPPDQAGTVTGGVVDPNQAR